MPFWSPPSATSTRPGARLLAENGMTGLERGPQPHIIASPPGTGAPIDRINYTPDTGEVHPPGVLAPIDKLNYSIVPHDELQAGGNMSPPGQPPQGAAQGGGDAGSMLSAASQSQPQSMNSTRSSNVWKNTGQGGSMGMGADSIVQSPGTPAGMDGLMGRYGESATLRTNAFSPGQPPLSPTPYGTGPGPRVQASGPTTRPLDQRASMTGNLGNWGQPMGTGADDDGDGYDDETGEPVTPEDAIYGNSGGGGTTGGTTGGATSGGGGAAAPVESQAPTSAPGGYHYQVDPPNGADGQPPRSPGGTPVRQTLWLVPDQPGKANIPIGYYDAQYKAGTSERPFIKFTEKEQRAQSPEYAKELDANIKTGSGRQIIEQVDPTDHKMHRVLVDKEHPEAGVINDYGVSQLDKVPTGQEGHMQIIGQGTTGAIVKVQAADGSWNIDKDLTQQARDAAKSKQQADLDKTQITADARVQAASLGATPYAVHQDSAGQTWIVNEQTGEKEKLGEVDPKQGVYESNGRLLKLSPDGTTATELYKPPPGYDIHYDSYGRAIAVNKDDPSKTQTVYTPEDYEDRKALDRQKTLADIEKSKSDLTTAKLTQVDTRAKMMQALDALEHPQARFMGSSDIYLPSGAAADVQRYNPETKTSTYEHVSGGDLSEGQKANIARMRSLMDEMDRAVASGDNAKASQISDQIKQSQAPPEQKAAPAKQEDQPGIINTNPALANHGGQDIRPGYPGYDPEHVNPQPPTNRTTAAGDIAHYDENGALTGITYLNTTPPGYEDVGSSLEEGGDQTEQPAEEEQAQPEELGADYWQKRRQRYMDVGTGTDIPQGGQGTSLPEKHRPAGNPGYSTEPTPMPPTPAPPPGGASPVGAPGVAGAPPGGGASDPASIAQQPSFNPLKPPDLAALGPPGGGGGTMPGIQPGAMPSQPGALPNLNDPLFQFAMQRRQAGGQGAPMGGGQDEQPAQPGGSSYAGWTPPVPQDDVAGIGHRFGQPMNMGEPFHSGVDLQAVEGTPTIAPVDGVVQRVEYNPQGLGITVILQGKDGTTHKLGHLKETTAYPGLQVSQGQDLQSKVGSTGNTTGSHLHWAVKTPDGQPTDPTASLGAMANLPPVPGTQMMGPPGGTASPGGPGPQAAAPPGMPPTPGVQSAGQPMQPMGGGADVYDPAQAFEQGRQSVESGVTDMQDIGDPALSGPEMGHDPNAPPGQILPWTSPEQGQGRTGGIATPEDQRPPWSGKAPPGGSGAWNVKRPPRNRPPQALEGINRKALGGVARDPTQEPDLQWWEDLGKRSSWNTGEVDPSLMAGGHRAPIPMPDFLNMPNITTLPGPLGGGHVPVPLPQMPGGHTPGPDLKLPDWLQFGAGADLEPADNDPLSPFGMNKKNPYGFNDRGLQRLWNQQHNRWVDQYLKQQGSFRTGSQNAPNTDVPPEPGSEEEAAQKEDQSIWQEREDQPRVYDPNAGPRHMPRDITSREQNTGPEGGYKPINRSRSAMPTRPDDLEAPQNTTAPADVSPYREGTTNPYPPNSDQGKAWARQKAWSLRKQQGQNALNDRLDKLADQGWPQGAIDEMKALGRAPTKDEIEQIRAKYKPTEPGTAETPAPEQTYEEWEAQHARRQAAGLPTTRPADVSIEDWQKQLAEDDAKLQQQPGWEPKGVTNPTPAPDKTGQPPQDLSWEELSKMSPENRPPPLGELERARQEGRAPSYTAMTKDEVDRYNAMSPEELKQFKPAEQPQTTLPDFSQMSEDQQRDWYENHMTQEQAEELDRQHNEQSGYNDAVRRGDTQGALDANKSGWEPKDLGNKMVTPPIEITGGHKPPVGPDIRDLIGKPAINVLPGPMPGGHIPVPLPSPPKGHVPGPEIKLPDITDIPHPDIHLPEIGRPDIQLPGWFPGQGDQTPQPTDQGTPESYSDMLERLRQLGQGAGADAPPSVPAEPSHPDMSSADVIALLEELLARLQAPRSGMGAGLQLGPIHLSTSMRQPMRMPSSRMEMGRRAGWTPRGGGMKRRSPMGTSAMMDLSA